MLPYNVGVLRQYGAAIAAALSAFIIGNWVGWPSSAVKKILAKETKLSMDHNEVSWAVSLLDFGNVISPIPAGYITDRFGRKMTLVILSLVLFTSWLLTIFGTGAFYLYIARLIVGISKGLVFTVVPIYLGEIAGTTVRGRVGTIFCSMVNFGVLFELCLGPFLSYETINLISSPFPVLFFLLFFKLPESPYFLFMKGRQSEAKKSLAWFRNLDKNSLALAQELKQISESIEKDKKQKSGFKELVNTSSSRRAIVITLGFALLQRLSGIKSIISYANVTLPTTGGYFSSDVYMVFFGITTIIGQSICIALIDKLGRKPLMIISCIGCAFSTGVSAVFYWLNEYIDLKNYNWVPYVCIIFYGLMFSIGIGTIPTIVAVELFSSDVRSRATSIAAILYAAGSFITNKPYLYIQSTVGVQFNFIFFTASSLVCLILTCTMFFETNAKTFTEIQDILKTRNSKTNIEIGNIKAGT